MSTSLPNDDGPPLPEMREAILSPDDVWALVGDIQMHTRIRGTLCKSDMRRQTSVEDAPLEDAVKRLLSHEVRAVQIRYAYDLHEWTDTLVDTPSGVRLVRCRHPQAE